MCENCQNECFNIYCLYAKYSMIFAKFRGLCSLFIYLFLYSGSKILFCHVFDVLSIHPKYLQFDDKPIAVELFSKELPHPFCCM
jgi:hypothetical protein